MPGTALRRRRRAPRRAEEERPLLGGVPDQHIDVGAGAGQVDGRGGEGAGIDRGQRAAAGAAERRLLEEVLVKGDDPLGVQFAEARRVGLLDPPRRRAQRLRPGERGLGRLGDIAERRGLEDGPAEQPRRLRGDEQVHRGQGAGRLSGERYAVGIAAERRDVLPDPLKRGDLIEQAPVRRGRVRSAVRGSGGQGWVRQPAEAAEPVVDGDDHRVRRRGEALAGIQAGAGVPDRKPATVEPHEHRTATAELRRENIQAEALLVGPGKLSMCERGRGPSRLWRGGSRGARVAHTGPPENRSGRREPGSCRVRDSLERDRLAGMPAADPAGADLHHRHAAIARPRPPRRSRRDPDAPPPTRSPGCGARRRARSRPRPRRQASGTARRHRR